MSASTTFSHSFRHKPSPLLRIARATKYLPRFKGLSPLLQCYQQLFPQGTLFRINDFDGDLKLDVNICETIGINLWHAPDLYEKQERKLFCSTLKPGDTVLDIGANIGIYSLLACKRNARVFSIEADPINARTLQNHIELNHFGNSISLYEMAATKREECLTLYRNPHNCGGSSLFGGQNPVLVHGRTIDSLQLPPINLCKIDIEGSELYALQGMTETIQRSPNMKLLVECLTNGTELVKLLRKHFAHIRIVGGHDVIGEMPLPYCNLWAHN